MGYFRKRAPINKAVDLGAVLTLAATGSEMNSGGVVTKAATQEVGFLKPIVVPKFSVLDPETTYSLPMRQISNGIVDAYVHVMEQYLTYPVNSPVQDRFAEGIMLTLIEEGVKGSIWNTRLRKSCKLNVGCNHGIEWFDCSGSKKRLGYSHDWT